MEKKEKDSITLGQLFKILWHNIITVIITTVICTVLAILYAVALVKPSYTSSTSILVDPAKFTSSVSNQDVSGGIRATGTIAKWVVEDTIIEATINALEEDGTLKPKQYTVSSFKAATSVSNTTTDLYVYVSFRSRNAELSKTCLNKLIEVGLQMADGVIVVDGSYQQISKANTGVFSGTSKTMIVIVGFIAGLVLSFVLVFVIEACKNKFRDQDDVENALEMKVIGIQVNDDQSKNLPKDGEELLNKSNYEKLLTNIDFSNIDNKIKIIEITSVEQADGKSTTAINLAKIMDLTNRKVLLVDLDLRRPMIHRYANIENKLGITDYCAQKATKEEVLTSLTDNIDVITAGTKVPNPLLILQSAALKDLLAELRDNYDYIILDCPPSYVAGDAKVSSTLADAILLTIAANKTKIRQTKKMIDEFSECKDKIIGVNLTRVKAKKKDYYYYSSYKDQ